MSKSREVERLQQWIDARQRHHLSHAHVQMARELGLNPTKLGKLDNHHQEQWKLSLRAIVEHLYEKRFGKARPDAVVPVEEQIRLIKLKRAARRAARRLARETTT